MSAKKFQLSALDRAAIVDKALADIAVREVPKRRFAASPPGPDSIRPALAALFANASCEGWSEMLADELVEALKRRIYAGRRVTAAPLLTNVDGPTNMGAAGVERIG
jgi:hypothetical protein